LWGRRLGRRRLFLWRICWEVLGGLERGDEACEGLRGYAEGVEGMLRCWLDGDCEAEGCEEGEGEC
jgi:hypothetical protein